MSSTIVGWFWNSEDIPIVEIEGRLFCLYGWNGEEYLSCWEVADRKGLDEVNKGVEFRVRPIMQEAQEGEFEIVDYEIL